MLTINSPGVEFLIAGCVEKIVRDLQPMLFFLFFFSSCALYYSTTGNKDYVQR